MSKTITFVPAMAFILLVGTAAVVNAGPGTAWRSFYQEAPAIRVLDPLANMVGCVEDENNTLTIHLTDVALYTGHVCPGVASGYMITCRALEKLYPNSVPVRGQIRLVATAPNDMLDVAAYITGARAFYGRDEINGGDLAVDPTLGPAERGRFTIVFQRKDTGKAVKVAFDKSKLMVPGQFKPFHRKVMDGTATAQEKQENWEAIQAIVRTALTSPPEGLMEFSLLDAFDYPEATDAAAE
jgi:formylmethanofuran dehydrogenase subunit E